jgi:tricorn protease
MQSADWRAAGAFTGLGVVLVGLALAATHLNPGKRGVDALPPLVTAGPAQAVAPSSGGVGASAPGEPSNGAAPPRLLENASLSKTQIAFSFAGEIWTVGRAGGDAQRLVAGQLRNYHPSFSPDGSQIAFTGVMDGNPDVYVVPAMGGEPRRLTCHPGRDTALGWTPDGKRVLFLSNRKTTRDLSQLFTVPSTGGAPEELPIPSSASATYSADGQHLAYVPFQQWQQAWRKYRGGQTTPVWIADLADSHVTKIPRTDSNDRSPAWVGDTVYFLSDRNGPFTLFGYDVKSKGVRELIKNPDGFDLESASASTDGSAIIYDQMGEVHVYDIASGASHVVPINIPGELPQVRPRFERLDGSDVLHAALSPSGKRVLLETRGEILSAPVEHGDVRNLTRTPGAADRDPSWSPDGKWVAWLSDESGEYALYFRAPDGEGPVKKVSLGDPPSYFYGPLWSPDSKKVVLSDKRLNLWVVDLDSPTPVKVDTDRFEGAAFDPSWSPDSRFIAYAKQLENHFHALYAYALDDKKTAQLTDGRSDASNPRFDRGGKYLWFLASTDAGPSSAGGMISMGRPSTTSVYAIVLQKDQPSPVAPQSDEEGDTGAFANGDKADKGGKKDDKAEKRERKDSDDKAMGHDDKGEKKDAPRVKIDLDSIDQRIVALPIDRGGNYRIEPAERGVLFVLSGPVVYSDEDYEEFDDGDAPLDVQRFDLKTRKTEEFLSKIDASFHGGAHAFSVSADGTKVLYAKHSKIFVAGSDKAPKEGDGGVKLDGAEVWVDPRAEWRQIYHEVWRIERDFLYDPHAHGLDLAATEKLYSRYLDGIADRDGLNDLLEAGLGNIVLGHVWAQGGSGPHQRSVGVGLLGADYSIEDGHYRLARILRGENWNPSLRAPLTEPGVKVNEGDFMLAVDGAPITADDDVYKWFLGRAGKQTVITVGPKADGAGSHPVTVVPVGSETALRLRTWMEDNRKKVDALSGGRVGYVYLPDTQGQGLTNFNRYYFSQAGKDGVVIDERFNHGGQIADYMTEVLQRTPLMGATTREGEDTVIPQQAIFGPKAMIANQMSGSGGDALPWLFKRAKLGPLVGVRTWGGLVGIGGYPRLMDGGRITAPRWGLYGTKGEWEVENHGVAPDVEVDQDPELVRKGHDPQLEKAVQLVMEALAKDPPKKIVRPAYPDYGDRLPKVRPAAP